MSLRILIVEDEQIVAADLEDKLQKLGHQVVASASTGEEAIASAEEFRPELVLMDVQLQGPMDGVEAAARVQRATGAPVIFITAFAGVFLRDPKRMKPPGICLSKPFSMHQLSAVLNAVWPASN